MGAHGDSPLYPAQVTVCCDHCGREATCDYMVSDSMTAAERLTKARAHLVKSEGWQHDEDGDDFCPEHAAPVESDEEKEEREETERAHNSGDHQYCGPTCEVEFPSEMLRNAILHRAFPGSGRMLDELIRRAVAEAVGQDAAIDTAIDTAQHPIDRLRAVLEEARMWARHGYEIGQRSCTWSDHGVALKWLTDNVPTQGATA